MGKERGDEWNNDDGRRADKGRGADETERE